MAYAMIGVPLMLMCLSNLGRVLAESVRQTYARLCIRQQLPHRYAAEGDDDDDDDNDEHKAYNGTQQYQPVPQKNEVSPANVGSIVKRANLKPNRKILSVLKIQRNVIYANTMCTKKPEHIIQMKDPVRKKKPPEKIYSTESATKMLIHFPLSFAQQMLII